MIDARIALGHAVHRLGRWDEAESLGRAALASAERVLGPDADATIDARELLAWNDLFRGRRAEAEAALADLDAFWIAADGEDSHQRIPILNGLGQAALDGGELDAAEDRYRDALALSRAAFPDGHPDMMVALSGLANTMTMSKRPEDAVAPLTEAAAIARRGLSPEHRSTLVVLGNLGLLQARLDRHEEAESTLTAVLETRRRTLPADHPDVGKSLEQLGRLEYFRGDFEAAIAWFQEARGVYAAAYGGPVAESIACLSNLATTLRAAGRFEEAIEVTHEVLEFDRADLGPDHPFVCDSLISLAGMLVEVGELEEARRTVDEAARIAALGSGNTLRPARCALVRSSLAVAGGDLPAAAAELEAAWPVLADSDLLDEAVRPARRLADALEAAGESAASDHWRGRARTAAGDADDETPASAGPAATD